MSYKEKLESLTTIEQVEAQIEHMSDYFNECYAIGQGINSKERWYYRALQEKHIEMTKNFFAQKK